MASDKIKELYEDSQRKNEEIRRYYVSNGYTAEEAEEKMNASYESRMTDMVSRGYVNPDYGEDGTVNNCSKAAAAVEIIKRGMEGQVIAGRQTMGSLLKAPEYWFDGAETVDDQSYEDMQKYFDSMEKGTSGIFNIFKEGRTAGHSVHFLKTTKGNVQFSDGQNGRVVDGLDTLMELYSWASKDANFCYTRLDNCEPNWDHMGEDGVFRGNRVRNNRTRKVVDRW